MLFVLLTSILFRKRNSVFFCELNGLKHWTIAYNHFDTSNFKESPIQLNRSSVRWISSFFFETGFKPITHQDFNTNLIDSLENLGSLLRNITRRGDSKKIWCHLSYFHWKLFGCKFWNRFKNLWKIDLNAKNSLLISMEFFFVE